MALVAATHTYRREGAAVGRDDTSYPISAEALGNGNLLRVMLLPRGDLRGPADSLWGEDSGAAIAHSRPAVYKALGQLYGFQPSSDVIAFLEQNPSLIPVLFAAWREIDRCFEAQPRMELRLRSDPEVEDLTTLFAIVHTASEPQAVFQGLKALDASWLSLQSPRVQELFNVDVEFD